MSRKFIDFLSSVGIMVFGVGLLFFCSLTLTAKPAQNFVSQLPLSSVKPFVQAGGDVNVPEFPLSRPRIPLSKAKAEFSGELTAISALVVDDESNAVLFSKNHTEIRPLASITKLMSLLVISDFNLPMSSTTVITEEDSDPFSHHFVVGEKYKLEDLWKVALIGSSNSAVRSLVRATGLTEEQFAKKMNEKARVFGLYSLQFVEPTGLDSRNMGHSTDVLKLLKFSLKNEKISEALHTSEYFIVGAKKKQHVWSTNWLLTNWIPNEFDKDILVGKTGFIDQSGYNFVARIPGPKNNVVRAVVLGASSNEARFTEAKKIAEWVFQNYVWPDDEGYGDLSSSL